MPEYRIHIIEADGRFSGAIKLVCSDDETAKKSARELIDKYDVELWQADRKIARFEHK